MKPTLKNILAVIAGIISGSVVNMAIVIIGPMIIPMPDGIDPSDMESLKANMHLFQPINFLSPWLAHAMGTLVGAIIAFKIAATNSSTLAYVIGVFFMLGGITNVVMLPSPTWFAVADIAGAYIPMAWLAIKLAGKK